MKLIVNNFNLKNTLLSGQCFRVTEEHDNSYTVILFDRVINIKQIKNELLIKSNNNDSLKNIIINYFDLEKDYNKINQLLNVDNTMRICLKKCFGYKIMKQDSFEMSISYIISQNNNVKRISTSIDKLCKLKGTKVYYNDKEYYLFPSYDQIKNITFDELRNIGVGFRDKYIIDFINKYPQMSNIKNLSTEDAIIELMTVKGIGLKVSSCILLFGYSRLDVFPIDTWVKQFISNNYGIKNDQKTIEKFTKDKFGKYSGLAIQYMFNSERNM